MNDFTKEELEFILDGTRHWCNKNIPTPWVFDFKNKIQSMIDNYSVIKIEKRKCPLCSNELTLPYLGEYDRMRSDCKNSSCTFSQSFKIKPQEDNNE